MPYFFEVYRVIRCAIAAVVFLFLASRPACPYTTNISVDAKESPPGAGKRYSYFSLSPLACTMSEECAFKVSVRPGDCSLEYALDWGDGTEADIICEPVICRSRRTIRKNIIHTYNTAGIFSVRLIPQGTILFDEPAGSRVYEVTVAAENPSVVFSRDRRIRHKNAKSFFLTVSQGFYPVRFWTVDFGDGTIKTGEGPFSGSISHFYWKKGMYRVAVRAVDTHNNRAEQVLKVRIRHEASFSDSESFFTVHSEEQAVPVIRDAAPGADTPENTVGPQGIFPYGGDRTIVEPSVIERELPDAENAGSVFTSGAGFGISQIELPGESHSGQKVRVGVSVDNRTAAGHPRCFIILDTQDVFTVRKAVDVSAHSRVSAYFTWIPRGEGEREVRVRLYCPAESEKFADTASKSLIIIP